MSTYYTLDNGGTAFVVRVSRSKLCVRVNRAKYVESANDTVPGAPVWSTRNAQKVFIGKSPLNAMTKFSGGHGPSRDGNSMLIKLAGSPAQYVHIGADARSFRSRAPITKFVSPVGNSSVPYPFAVDSKGGFYFFPLGGETRYMASIPAKDHKDPSEHYFSGKKIASKVIAERDW